jgi:hypothetical protein
MKKLTLLYLFVVCFFSWFLIGCSSTPRVLISTLDEIRQRSDPSKKLIVVFKKTGYLVYITTNENTISKLDELQANFISGTNVLTNANVIATATHAFHYNLSAIMSGTVRLGKLYTKTYSDVAAFNLSSDDHIRIVVDATTDTGSYYGWQVLALDIKPDTNEQFYVIEKDIVREISDASELTSLFLEKRWYPQLPSNHQNGFIVFE